MGKENNQKRGRPLKRETIKNKRFKSKFKGFNDCIKRNEK